MSVKKSKLDLLVRVRYANPLPAPPCPPKLLAIPTNPMRYAQPSFLDEIASDTALPMIADAECGMPLDLSKYPCLWEEDADDAKLNPDPNDLPILDPEDMNLLLDPAVPFTNGSQSNVSPSHLQAPWLRKTEYISREVIQRSTSNQEPKLTQASNVDISRPSLLATVEETFSACNPESGELDLTTLKHPTKPRLTAVDSYELFPDFDIWPDVYDIFRFSERPGDRPVNMPDPRPDCGIFRPMESEGDHFLAYYLPQDDESALGFKERRMAPMGTTTSVEGEQTESTAFHFVRDYEVVKIEQWWRSSTSNEYLIALVDEEPNPTVYGEQRKRKLAYHKDISRRMTLKKKRGNLHSFYDQKWDVINVKLEAMDKGDLRSREQTMAPMHEFDHDGDGPPDEGLPDLGWFDIS